MATNRSRRRAELIEDKARGRFVVKWTDKAGKQWERVTGVLLGDTPEERQSHRYDAESIRRQVEEEANLPDGMVKRYGAYYAQLCIRGRRIRKKLSKDLRVACSLLTELRARCDRGDFGLLDNAYAWKAMKTEFVSWARQHVRESTYKVYVADLAMIDRFMEETGVRATKASEFDASFVYRFREWRMSGGGCRERKPKITPRTINKQVGTLKHVFNLAVENGHIERNPIAAITPIPHDTPAKERRSLTADEVTRIMREAPDYLRPMLHLYLTSGMRRGEVVELKFSDIDLVNQTAKIRAANSKSKRAREVPLDKLAIAEICRLKSEAEKRQPLPGKTPHDSFSRDHVFVTSYNTPRRNNLLRAFYSVCKRAGIEGAEQNGSIDLHALRGTFITVAIENGASPKCVQDIVGHATLGMTMGIYAKATDNGKRRAIGALPYADIDAPKLLSIEEARRQREAEKRQAGDDEENTKRG